MTRDVLRSAAEALRERIRRAGGSIPFGEWMRFALYDPEHGYYSQRIRTVGREGDFSTSATLHPALGRAVAAWARHHRKDAATGRRWHLIELGGGNGEMAGQVLDSLGWWARRGLQYHLIEVSAGLRAAQRERLAAWGPRISWYESLTDALKEAGGTALIFSNEFVDAFPCARWVLDENSEWREIRVIWPDDAPHPLEVRGAVVPVAIQTLASVADAARMATWVPGQTVEVFASYRQWQRDYLAHWKRGRLLTIDYGDDVTALYHRRPAGTLRAYCRQIRFTGREIYERVGRQDLTADINFTDLQRWGDELGFATVSCDTQSEFLRRWLPGRTLRQAGRDPGPILSAGPRGGGRCIQSPRTDPQHRPGGQIGA